MKVATYGFAEDQGRKLGRILQLSKSADYELVDFDSANLPELLLVFGEEQLQSSAIVALPDTYKSRLILVAKRRPKIADHLFVGYPLISSRVLAALEQAIENTQAQSEFDPPDTSVATDDTDNLALNELIETDLAESENISSSHETDVLIPSPSEDVGAESADLTEVLASNGIDDEIDLDELAAEIEEELASQENQTTQDEQQNSELEISELELADPFEQAGDSVEVVAVDDGLIDEVATEEDTVDDFAIGSNSVDETSINEPLVEESFNEEPFKEEPVNEDPVNEESFNEQPSTNEPLIDESLTHDSLIADLESDDLALEELIVDDAVIDESLAEPSAESLVDMVVEPPVESPSVEPPLAESSVSDVNALDESVSEQEIPEQGVSEEPSVDEVTLEEQASTGSVSEGSVSEELISEDTVLEDTVSEDNAATALTVNEDLDETSLAMSALAEAHPLSDELSTETEPAGQLSEPSNELPVESLVEPLTHAEEALVDPYTEEPVDDELAKDVPTGHAPVQPEVAPEEPSEVPFKEPFKVPEEATGRTYRVLVVDDSQPMQQALAKELNTQFEHLDIDFADEGLVALELAEENDYDFIFLDIMMPGIDGFETCTKMRAMEKLKKLPIIMLSSKSSPLDEVKGIMAGSSTYLTKPIDPAEFHKVVGRIRKWLDNFS